MVEQEEKQDFISKIENFYNFIKNLPYTSPKKFSTISSSFRRTQGIYNKLYFTHFIATREEYFNGLNRRMNLWKDMIIPEYCKLSLEKIAEKEGLEIKISNYPFRSRLSINGSKTIKLDVWSPKFSTLVSYIIGNRVKAKFRKN